MYFARACYVFQNNQWKPKGVRGHNCILRETAFAHWQQSATEVSLFDPTLVSMLSKCDVSIKFYAEGYDRAAINKGPLDCFPHHYDPTDIPFSYYEGTKDRPDFMEDLTDFKRDLDRKSLPSVSFIKAIGTRTGHPSCGKLSDVQAFLKEVYEEIQ